MKRLLTALLTVVLLAANASGGETPPPANSDALQPRVWVEVESTGGAVSRMELLEIVNGTLVMKSLDGLRVEVEQEYLTSLRIAAIGDTQPWKSKPPKPNQPPPDKPQPPNTPRTGEVAPATQTDATAQENRVRELAQWLRPNPWMVQDIVQAYRDDKFQEKQALLQKMVIEARTVKELDGALANLAGLIFSWRIELVPVDQMERNIRDTATKIKNESVRETVLEVLAYLKSHPDEARDIYYKARLSFPTLMEKRGLIKSGEERPKRRFGPNQ